MVKEHHPDPNKTFVPIFSITAMEKNLGYIQRGHRYLEPKYRQQGVFGAALSQLEAHEKQIFRGGNFGEYKKQIIISLGEHIGKPRFVDFIMRLQKPTHLEFSRRAEIAVPYMRKDYSLAKPTLEELNESGLPIGAPLAMTIQFLEENHARLKDKVLFLLTKPAKMKA